ncbi:transposase [Bradyrhizobium elkanii]|uniref:transposase n=1 Tax=Bradyrhizobium elkanii TaxID=29448 RepID=UPI001BABC1B7|nr:transposase [Bradyrhizobium elkanii]MBR1159147.1 transposase [Bradyrhizobium elkanii]
MRHSLHTEDEILCLLCEADAGVSIAEICSTARISLRTFYRWRKRYGGQTAPAIRHMRELEIENRRLRSLLARLSDREQTVHPEQPLAQQSQVQRQEFGCGQRSPTSEIKSSRGASLGRFAAVRYTH